MSDVDNEKNHADLVSERAPVRSQITKISNDIKKELDSPKADKRILEAKLKILEGYWNKLQQLDMLIIDTINSEIPADEDGSTKKADMIQAEFDSRDSYEEKYQLARIDVENAIRPKEQSEYSVSTVRHGGGAQTRRLPKYELMKYDGEIKNWLVWWSQFSKIHDDEDLADADKLHYLFQSMKIGTEAHQLVSGYLQTADNYPVIIAALEERYGDTDMLLQFYVRELLQLVISNATSKEKMPITQLYLQLESHLRSLETLNLDRKLCAVFLYPLVESSLPLDTLRAWHRSNESKKTSSNKTRLDMLMKFVGDEVKAEQRNVLAQSGFASPKPQDKNSVPDRSQKKSSFQAKAKANKYPEAIPTAAGLASTSTEAKGKQADLCAFCEGKHDSARCVTAQKLTLEERKTKIRNGKRCNRCLNKGHWESKCRVPMNCLGCGEGHLPIMCPKLCSSATPVKKDEPITTATASKCSNHILLNTIWIKLVGKDGKAVKARLFGDTGSQRSYIKSSVADQIKAEATGREWLQTIVFGGGSTELRPRIRHKATLASLTSAEEIKLEFLAEDRICGQLPRVPAGPWIQELSRHGISISDLGEGSSDVHILLGSDHWGKVVTGRTRKLQGGLMATETIFGWTLAGPVPEQSTAMATIAMNIQSQDVAKLWSLEAIGIQDPIERRNDMEENQGAIHFFNRTVREKKGGGYIVRLPWKDEIQKGTITRPMSNHSIALKRLSALKSKLNLEKFKQYDEVFKSWIEADFIKTVEKDTGDGHYLPHRPVFKESVTTPVRPVFDASCKAKNSFSLNDALHKGPNLLELIPSLLLRFREKKIGVTSDVKKAFQMIHVHEDDQKWQKFLWWKDESYKEVVVYQHQRVIFGMNCSPFLLGAVIQNHLAKYPDSEVARKLGECFYVDNCVTSVSTPEEYQKFLTESTEIMKEANMDLRQWASSHLGINSEVTSEIFKANPGASADFIEARETISVLGLLWDRQEDTLRCDVTFDESSTDSASVTCRKMLSATAKIFDPVGFTAPITTVPKLLIQEAWKAKVGWDDQLPKEIQDKFKAWLAEIHLIKSIKIPRSFFVQENLNREIHVFCDASKDAYACAIFLRSFDDREEDVRVHLLSAKSRIAPIKRPSIPRMELMSAVIAVRQAEVVKTSVDWGNIPFYFWTDSTTALAWIHRKGEWGVFVCNRVKEVRTHSQEHQWHHISGTRNPADFPSREQTPKQVLESKWWEGPDWLRTPRYDWPEEYPQDYEDEDEIRKELKKSAVTMTATFNPPPFSSYSRNVRVYLWILRFFETYKKRKGLDYVPVDMKRAEKAYIKTLQLEAFHKPPGKMYGLQVYQDEDSIVRVKSRLTNSNEESDFIYPILMPNKHPAVEILILNMHKFYSHAGVQFLVTKLREKYWIPQARRTVRKVIWSCATCRRYDSQPAKVPVAPLPAKRVEVGEPFQTTGIDLAGPLFLRDKSKVWIVLFTCATYRGVYLDLVTSLSTEVFLGALERFISIYGRPNTIFSDNGTNFVGSDNLFRLLDWDEISKRSEVRAINWIFNPPSAPWWGGWWERLIRSVKDQLRRMLGKAQLSYEELRTCLAGVAATMNDRPLTAVTEDNGDLVALTPNMFIRGNQQASFLKPRTCLTCLKVT